MPITRIRSRTCVEKSQTKNDSHLWEYKPRVTVQYCMYSILGDCTVEKSAKYLQNKINACPMKNSIQLLSHENEFTRKYGFVPIEAANNSIIRWECYFCKRCSVPAIDDKAVTIHLQQHHRNEWHEYQTHTQHHMEWALFFGAQNLIGYDTIVPSKIVKVLASSEYQVREYTCRFCLLDLREAKPEQQLNTPFTIEADQVSRERIHEHNMEHHPQKSKEFAELISSFWTSPSPVSSKVTQQADTRISKRKDYLSWDDYFMGVAFLSAKRSKDPRTQVGACIVDPDRKIVGIGYNGFPNGCDDDALPWARSAPSVLDTKYPYVCHAEMNAILNKNSAQVKGCTLYVALFPCNECVKLIIQSGITRIIYMCDKYHDDWKTIAARRMLDMAKVICTQHHLRSSDTILLDFKAADG